MDAISRAMPWELRNKDHRANRGALVAEVRGRQAGDLPLRPVRTQWLGRLATRLAARGSKLLADQVLGADCTFVDVRTDLSVFVLTRSRFRRHMRPSY